MLVQTLRFALPALLGSSLVLGGCAREGASESPADETVTTLQDQDQTRDAPKAPHADSACELTPVNDDLVRVRHTSLDFSFVAILPPLQVECEDSEEIVVRNHDGLVQWTVTAIGQRETLDHGAFLEALWRKNEAVSSRRRRVFGGGLEVTPRGQVVLSYIAVTPAPSGDELRSSVVFVTLRQRANGETFLLRMVAQVEPKADPELSRARMRGPFMPMFDEFALGDASGG